MQAKFRRIIILCLGWALMILGVAGLFLPVVQGILFLFLGLIVLSQESKWAHTLLAKIQRRYPSLSSKIEQARQKQKSFMRRILGR